MMIMVVVMMMMILNKALTCIVIKEALVSPPLSNDCQLIIPDKFLHIAGWRLPTVGLLPPRHLHQSIQISCPLSPHLSPSASARCVCPPGPAWSPGSGPSPQSWHCRLLRVPGVTRLQLVGVRSHHHHRVETHRVPGVYGAVLVLGTCSSSCTSDYNQSETSH